MLSTNTNFDARHALDYKTPLYLIHFDGESVDYCNQKPGSPTNTLKRYLKSIQGLDQRVKPEEGQASIGGVKVTILDKADEITALLATDSYYFHRKKVTIKAGYLGMDETDMLTIFVGWVTGYKLSKDLLSYEFAVTDPKKWMQRKIFRGSETTNVTVSGNPINILLACLTSTGDGTNGDYDLYAEEDGLGIDDDYINVSDIEAVRDDFFPGDSHYMQFTMTGRMKAKDFFESQIFKPLNIYPLIDGQGRFFIKPYKPPLAAYESVQSFDEDLIIGKPDWSGNLEAVINECEFYYDYDSVDTEFDQSTFYANADSIDNRGPGSKVLTVKCKGWHTDLSPGSMPDRVSDAIVRRKNAVFLRWANPPIKIKIRAFFSRWLSVPGDIVPITDSRLPDLESGTRGLSAQRMEIINRKVYWKEGRVSFELLDTGFGQGLYGVISPTLTVVSGASSTQFTVSTADAEKISNFTNPEMDVFDAGMRNQASQITILTVNTGMGVITCDSIGSTPQAGWKVQFSDYSNCTAEQQLYAFAKTTSNDLLL